MKRIHLVVAATLLTLAAPLHAQSLFATRGLGVPLSSTDARVTALGGIGVGLAGFHATLTNPAELGGSVRRGVTAVLQPVSLNVDIDGETDGTSGTRFPLLAISYPVTPRLTTVFGFGGYLDQGWGVTSESIEVIGGVPVPVTDELRSTGGISQMRFNAAYALTPELAIGAGAGLLVGSTERTVRRTFADSAGVIRTFDQRMGWNFSAPIASVGVRWDIAGRARVAASAMFGGSLDAEGDTVTAVDRTYDGPSEFAAGASARVSSVILATAGAVWSRVPGVEADESRSALRVGGGIEYEGLRSGLRTYPLRVGGHWQRLPYYRAGEDPATEWGVGAGFGFRLGDPMNPAAVADIGVERGGRSGLTGGSLSDGVRESLWRVTLSMSLFGT